MFPIPPISIAVMSASNAFLFSICFISESGQYETFVLRKVKDGVYFVLFCADMFM